MNIFDKAPNFKAEEWGNRREITKFMMFKVTAYYGATFLSLKIKKINNPYFIHATCTDVAPNSGLKKKKYFQGGLLYDYQSNIFTRFLKNKKQKIGKKCCKNISHLSFHLFLSKEESSVFF